MPKRGLFDDMKGQITVFIIIGIVIVAAATVFLLLRGEPEELPAESSGVG